MLIDDERHLPVKIFSGGRKAFAEGGLAAAAEDVRGASRNGDEIVVHVNRREFQEMVDSWGEPHINPETGLPEFWSLKDAWNDAKDYIVPIGAAAAGALLPGIGSAVGSALPGVAGMLGETGTQALATGLLGAGAGYLASGGRGALLGGLGGALGAYGGDIFRNGFDGSAVGTALAAAQQKQDALAAVGLGGAAASAAKEGGGMGSGAIAPALLMAALNMAGGALGGEDEALATAEGNYNAAQDQNGKPLPTWENQRRRRVYNPNDVPDYTQEGEREYFDNNNFADGGSVRKDRDRLPENGGYYYDPGSNADIMLTKSGISPLSWIGYMLGLQQQYPEVADGKTDLEAYADGGNVYGYSSGGTPHGRSDNIEALLSPGEYVIDAETVALLGNGSTEAGADQLDQLRQKIRAHKGQALSRGEISPDALPAEQYI